MDRDRRRITGWRLVLAAAAVTCGLFLAVFFIWPLLGIVGRGLAPDWKLDLSGFANTFADPRIWRAIGRTLAQAVAGTALCLLLGVPGAFVLYRMRFAGQRVARAIATVPFVLPSVVVALAITSLLGRSAQGFWPVLAALVIFNYSVVVRVVGSAWARLDQRPAAVAASLGASSWRVARTITLPALARPIGSAAALVFLFCATAYGTVLILGGLRYTTVETEIYLQTTQFLNLSAAAALSIVQILIVVIALTLSARGARSGGRTTTAQPGGAIGNRLDRPLAWVAVPMTAVALAGIGAPIIALLAGSLRRDGAWTLANYTDGFDQTVRGASVGSALGTSLRLALWAAALALALGLLLVTVLSRRPRRRLARRAMAAADGLFMLPLGVSAVTIGFGFLITLNRPPFDLRSSLVLIPIAQALVALPLVVRVLLPAIRGVPGRQLEAAASLGAGPGRVFRTIEFPALARALPIAAGFAFATAMGEFGATSFLSRPDHPTLPVYIFSLLSTPGRHNYGLALAACVILAAVCAALMSGADGMRRQGVEQL